ncbi:N-acetylneuraminate synthase [Geoalkalibacter ferrihydriticus]|uniref:N-acetylneuraminic acid synthase n=2 Tax=Geoalkalibacter ferrihydriticus TaxID=392333 RepID=A0A0C2HL56_9BACT|nr:N-acetylneuraminate synthase family protein [Geoalkalibacter ferrihydriticus]KIH75715.1 N-acetylneuraminic acid synthase [Geoalkalibacter ferrihydriticus DSM 17813]SDM75414.1 N-acetylneuraminate synthase [Geoalkalibacter ferrihydriticus]
MTKPLFVAEVSSNHHRDLERCFRFIDTAAAVGCDAVKFQLFKIEELFAPEILEKSPTHRARKDWELPVEFLPHLAARCRERKVQFSCTPFYLDAVEELLPHVTFYKIASYELLWTDLLIACARTGKPVVLSTGMATMDEIHGAVETVRTAGCKDLILLHCVSGYPAPVEQCNLAAINTLAERFACPTGWSDHSVSPAVIYRAVHHWGARMIEFHLDLEGEGDEFKTGHCWLPEKIKEVIAVTVAGFEADGAGEKIPAAAELPDREWRADPIDGLRPLNHVRENWRG